MLRSHCAGFDDQQLAELLPGMQHHRQNIRNISANFEAGDFTTTSYKENG